jgi:dTMP kinase
MSRFVVIEGSDGTGKHTQAELLASYIRDELKLPVLELSFPRYDNPSATYITRYLNGEYGDKVHPDLASFLYAFDRWAARGEISGYLRDHPDGYVISDRYIGSNLGHQGGKIADPAARHRYFDEILDLEYNQFKIPRPDVNVVLTLPTDIAQANVDKKGKRNYTSKKRDLHEKDPNHLANANRCYIELCQRYPDEFIMIDCYNAESGKMKSIDTIHQAIVETLVN